MNEMENKHTDGPWKYVVQPVPTYGYYIVQDKNDPVEAEFIGDVGGGVMPDSEIEANAKLMAAAPSMYEIIKGLDISEIRNTSPQFADQIESLLTRINS